jgi:uncharacterized RDD family membrane protein YckC
MSQPPPPGYGVPQPGTHPVAGQPGELVERFVARLIDSVILGVVGFLISSIVVVGLLMGQSVNAVGASSSFAAGVVATLISVALGLAYYAFFETTRGQTVGKMVMKLRVSGPQGGLPTVEESIRRNIFLAFGLASVVPIIGGLIGGIAQLVAAIMIAVGISNDTAGRQAWHDHFAGGTRVIKEG